jgi:hypothetical protein
MTTRPHPWPSASHAHRDAELERRVNDAGWGVFLVLMGVLWLLPAGAVPDGSWLLATGVLLLGLNAVRRRLGVPLHQVGLLLGVLALLAGVAAILDFTEPLLPATLVVTGAWIVVRPLLARRR